MWVDKRSRVCNLTAVASSRELTELFFGGSFDEAEFLLDPRHPPAGTFVCRPLGEFLRGGAFPERAQDSWIWFPEGGEERLRKVLKLGVTGTISDCVVCFAAIHAGGIDLRLWGKCQRFFSLSGKSVRLKCKLGGTQGNSFVLGEGASIVDGRAQLLNCDARIGASALWSDEVIIQGGDQHGVIDLDAMKTVNGARCHVKLRCHVWLGRRSMVMKIVTKGWGSIASAGSVVSKDVPPATAVVGSDNRHIREGKVSWGDSVAQRAEVARLKNWLVGAAG